MNTQPTLVFIYGPPAAGKLTVANALSALTGYRVFHNHASMDLVNSVLKPWSPESSALTKKIRIDVIEAAIQNRVDLIFTMVYAHPEDAAYVADIEAVVEPQGRVCYVQLLPDRSTLDDRVVNESRHGHAKLKDVASLQKTLERWDTNPPIHDSDLSIDNSIIAPEDVAKMIVAHHNLRHADVRL